MQSGEIYIDYLNKFNYELFLNQEIYSDFKWKIYIRNYSMKIKVKVAHIFLELKLTQSINSELLYK